MLGEREVRVQVSGRRAVSRMSGRREGGGEGGGGCTFGWGGGESKLVSQKNLP